MNITLIIVIVTVAVSYLGFTRTDLKYKYTLIPYQVIHYKQYYRMISSGFLHSNWWHLGFNMLAFYSFGMQIEYDFIALFGETKGLVNFLLLYFLGLIFSDIYSVARHKDNHGYSSLGASGAVSAIVFTSILLHPEGKIGFFFIPMPSVVFGVIYLALSAYMSNKNYDNVSHDSHFWGSLFGFVFPIVLKPELFPRFINIVQELMR